MECGTPTQSSDRAAKQGFVKCGSLRSDPAAIPETRVPVIERRAIRGSRRLAVGIGLAHTAAYAGGGWPHGVRRGGLADKCSCSAIPDCVAAIAASSRASLHRMASNLFEYGSTTDVNRLGIPTMIVEPQSKCPALGLSSSYSRTSPRSS